MEQSMIKDILLLIPFVPLTKNSGMKDQLKLEKNYWKISESQKTMGNAFVLV